MAILEKREPTPGERLSRGFERSRARAMPVGVTAADVLPNHRFEVHLANLPATLLVCGHPMTETVLPTELMHALVTDLQLAGRG